MAKKNRLFLRILAAAFTGAALLLALRPSSVETTSTASGAATPSAKPQTNSSAPIPVNRATAVFQNDASPEIPWPGKNPAARRARRIQPDPRWLTPGFKPEKGD